ncbi:response regulator [Candidatus Wolfebacteria bacterium]|nr:response regulator [Candidatus Wolfebacteria bacterium]
MINNKPRILIVDDAEFTRKLIAQILKEELGITDILEAEDGLQALEIFKKENPNIILLDIIMPKLNGIEFLKKIDASKVNVILISAITQSKIQEETKKLGAKAYLVKPFAPEEVIGAVKKFLPVI